MFEDFNMIPIEDVDIERALPALSDISNKLTDVGITNGTRVRWNGPYQQQFLVQLLNQIKHISIPTDMRAVLRYYTENPDRFVMDQEANPADHGIVINKGAQTHYFPDQYKSAVYLENAQNFMKQSPQHFLRIFTVQNSQLLFVYTNKNLSCETIYKLYALSEGLFPLENKTFSNFINACVEKDANKAREILNAYFSSDAINEKRFEKFKNNINTAQKNKIERLKSDIDHARANMQTYENEILNLATEIRDKTDQIFYLRNTENDEEARLLYKYLNRSPYIKQYKTTEHGYIELHYVAPIKYFSEAPAERIMHNMEHYEEQIIKIILGRKYELMTKCYLTVNTMNFNVQIQRERDTVNVLPHPHIDRFGCFGNHLATVKEAAEAGNFVGAIEQVTQAVLNLNFYDGCVIEEMLRNLVRLRSGLETWHYVETGELLTTDQVIQRGDYYEEA